MNIVFPVTVYTFLAICFLRENDFWLWIHEQQRMCVQVHADSNSTARNVNAGFLSFYQFTLNIKNASMR